MNLILFIFAISGGITGNLENSSDTYMHIQPEIGIRINDLFLTAQLYSEPDTDALNQQEYQDAFRNNQLKINMYVDTDYFTGGIQFAYELQNSEYLTSIYFRAQSWR